MPAPHKGLEGLDKTLKNLENFSVNLASCTRTACWQLGVKVGYQAKQNARTTFTGTPSWAPEPGTPTGILAGSVTTRANFTNKLAGLSGPAKAEDAVKKPGGSPDQPLVVTGTNKEYAEFPEFGTQKMHARPYLYPAFFACENDLPKILRDVVEKKAALRNFDQRLPIFEAEGSWE